MFCFGHLKVENDFLPNYLHTNFSWYYYQLHLLGLLIYAEIIFVLEFSKNID